MRRCRVVLTYAELHELLNLSDAVQIVAVGAEIDPPVISIIAESSAFNATLDREPAPVANLEYLR